RRHRRQVLVRIEGHLGVEGGIDRLDAAGGHEQGIAVGRRARRLGAAKVASRAGLVLDGHGLAEDPAQLVGRGARGDIDGAGRRAAESLLARAAKPYGIPFPLATPAAATIERVAAEAGGRLWFQLYVVRDREFREKLVLRASNSGYEAMLVTVDLAVSGKR